MGMHDHRARIARVYRGSIGRSALVRPLRLPLLDWGRGSGQMHGRTISPSAWFGAHARRLLVKTHGCRRLAGWDQGRQGRLSTQQQQ